MVIKFRAFTFYDGEGRQKIRAVSYGKNVRRAQITLNRDYAMNVDEQCDLACQVLAKCYGHFDFTPPRVMARHMGLI